MNTVIKLLSVVCWEFSCTEVHNDFSDCFAQ